MSPFFIWYIRVSKNYFCGNEKPAFFISALSFLTDIFNFSAP